MKKIIFVLAAIAITVGAYAQTDSTNRKMSPREPVNNHHQSMQNNPVNASHPDGVLMQNGKLMRVQNGKMTILHDNDMTMSNGTRIMSDGYYIQKDGTKLMIKEGQHMDMAGNLIFLKTNKDKNMYLVPDSIKNKKF
ncbi:MAG: hypothetical protein IH597_11745 [Bacteroidales bacterium]|nr:hypothetical protein [Bacteroidales bacterium]